MAFAAIGMKCDWNFCHPGSIQAGLDNHFRGELHSGAPLMEILLKGPAETAKAAVDVMNGSAKPPPRQKSEHWISPPAVQKRHGSRQDFAAPAWEATPLNQIVSLLQLGKDFTDF